MDKNNVTQTNVSTGPQAERLARWQFLYSDAFTKRKPLVDDKLKLRKDLYEGTRIKDGKVESKCLRNMCFELIESQINSSIPQPKITPTDASKQDLAHTLESFLRLEMDRLQSESTNDRVERGVLKQGTHFYEIGWDETIRRGRTKGGITVVDRPIEDVWLQPGVASFDDIEYLFVKSRESINKIKKLTGKIPPESPNFLGLVDIITCWYYNEDGYVARFAMIITLKVAGFVFVSRVVLKLTPAMCVLCAKIRHLLKNLSQMRHFLKTSLKVIRPTQGNRRSFWQKLVQKYHFML